MDEPKRARRRRDLMRMKAKARRVRPYNPSAKDAEHLATCSCWMCCNRRRIDGPTLQELRLEAIGVMLDEPV
ncbi:hypothetical protein [Ancylobacter terrae]|uniref:hypothetical protein n=1 Tax=Ancylobacter sp. sgz301288 TaxID=3342077 RepID=UPI00385EEA25